MELTQIESAVSSLPMPKLSEFAEWFDDFYAQKVDGKLEKAVQDGKFDALAAKAKKQFDAGDYSDL